MTLPEQEKVRRGLEREDLLTVVFDPVMTDTALYADIVLPATTFLERTELSRGYGAYALQEAPPVIPPVGESRPNHEVFADLCRRTGVARPGDPETTAEITDAVFGSSRVGAPLRKALARDGVAFPEVGKNPVQFVDAFPRTADRKVHLVPENLDREAPLGLYGFREEPAGDAFPLTLISPASDRTISSTLGELHAPRVPLEMHPSDAAPRGIADGAAVRVFNGSGEVRCPARLDEGIRPGVVFLPKGLWSHNTDNGATASALAPDTLTDLGGGACFNDARVAGRAGLDAGGARAPAHARPIARGAVRGPATASNGGSGCGRRSCSRPAFCCSRSAGGLYSRSLALLADAAHMFADIAALILAYAAMGLADRAPTGRHSFGFYRAEILAAFVNAELLLVMSGWIALRSDRPVAANRSSFAAASCWPSPSRASSSNFIAMRLLSQRPRTKA